MQERLQLAGAVVRCLHGGNERSPGTGADKASAGITVRNEHAGMSRGRRVIERHLVHNLKFEAFVGVCSSSM